MGQIILLIGVILLNLFLKDIEKKRRQEREKYKKNIGEIAPELNKDRDLKQKSKKGEPSLLKEFMTLLNEENEKKTQVEKKITIAERENELVKKEVELKNYKKDKWIGGQAKVTESAYEDFEDEFYRRGEQGDLDEKARLEAEEYKKRRAKMKRELLNGIIFAEILSEPKAIKRSM